MGRRGRRGGRGTPRGVGGRFGRLGWGRGGDRRGDAWRGSRWRVWSRGSRGSRRVGTLTRDGRNEGGVSENNSERGTEEHIEDEVIERRKRQEGVL